MESLSYAVIKVYVHFTIKRCW